VNILLVRPPRIKQAVTLGEFMFCEPIGLEIVYGVLKDRYQIRILDLMIEENMLNEECKSFKPDIVGITSLCIDVNAVKDIAQKVKMINPNVVTVVGGTQAFLNPEAFFCDSIDHVMKYTTRNNLNQLYDTLAAKQDIPLIDGIHSKVNSYQSTECFGRNEYIVPDRSSTQKYRQYYSYLGYKPCAIMQTSLGCSKNCDFCLRWRLEGKTEQDIDLNIIIDQIKEIQEPSIMIYDNDFLNNGVRLEAFCDLLEKNDIKKNFICYTSVKSIISHPDTIKRVTKNGLRAVLVGYETFSPLTPFPNLPLYDQYRDRLLFDVEAYEQWSFGKVSIRPSRISLRRYYYEMVKTILFVNLFMNSTSYMMKRFGFSTLLRLFIGSIKVMPAYLKLMIKS